MEVQMGDETVLIAAVPNQLDPVVPLDKTR
jgi:hypothetical protein